MSPDRRRGRIGSYRRRTPHREQKITVLIVCEGRETERIYLDGFKREEIVSSQYAITVARGKGGSRIQIVQHAIDKKENSQKQYDHVFCVLDTESLENEEAKQELVTARNDAEENNITLYLSNPAFEVWFLAHFERTSQGFRNCDAVIAELNKKWGREFKQEYDKSDRNIYQKLASRTPDAVSNAKDVAVNDHGDESDIALRNSSTDFYKLVQKLQSTEVA